MTYKVVSIVHGFDIWDKWWHRGVQTIPLNVPEPLVTLDVFGIVRKHMTSSMVLRIVRSTVFDLVTPRAESSILILDDVSDQVLTSLTDNRLMRERESSFVCL